jgi:hypothetical protein
LQPLVLLHVSSNSISAHAGMLSPLDEQRPG